MGGSNLEASHETEHDGTPRTRCTDIDLSRVLANTAQHGGFC